MKNTSWSRNFPIEPGYYWVRLWRFSPSQNKNFSTEEERNIAKKAYIISLISTRDGSLYSLQDSPYLSYNRNRLEFQKVSDPLP